MSANSSGEGISFDLSGPLVNRILTVGYIRAIFDGLTHVMLLLNLAAVAWICLRLRLRGTANHALYSALGLFFFVGASQMLMCRTCWLAGSVVGRTLHAVLGALALWTGGLGILAKTLNKRRENKRFDQAEWERHMASKHSRCGLAGYLLLAPCVITGVVLLGVRNWVLDLFHRILGLFGFGCLASSMWFSYSTAFARRECYGRWLQVLQVTTVGGALLVIYEGLIYAAGDVVACWM